LQDSGFVARSSLKSGAWTQTFISTVKLPISGEIMVKILVVEDNEEFRAGAEQYFATRDDVEVVYAKDYKEAKAVLDTQADTLDGAIVDFFFPMETGSGDTSLGRSLIERLVAEDPKEQNARLIYEELSKHLDYKDKDVAALAKRFAINYANDIPDEGPSEITVIKVLAQGSFGEKEFANHIFKNTFSRIPSMNNTKDHYGALERGLAESEHNQPLGLSVAPKLKQYDIPFVYATSTFHHAETGQKVHDYANSKIGVPIVECGANQENEKATQEFWERAYTTLERNLK